MASKNNKPDEKLGEMIGYLLIIAFTIVGLMFMVKGFIVLYEWLF
nr:MAG TPA: hypothetical protein [Caudoviricetes sp.]